MKANIQRTIDQLKPSEKAKIDKMYFDRWDEELCTAQITWIKMACGVLHRIGLNADKITQFVGGWKMMYRRNSRIADKAEQDAFLAREMEQIFGEGGFPEDFVQSFREIGR